MALKEARCENCGSIIWADTEKDEVICMFCYAHTDRDKAIRIAEHPEDYTFPNKEQPEPTEEELKSAFSAVPGKSLQKNISSKPAIKKRDINKPTPAEIVAQSKTVMIEPKLSKKTKIIMISSIAAVLIILAAYFVPTTIDREQKKTALEKKISHIMPGELLTESRYAFEGQANQRLTLVLPDEVGEKDADAILDRYKEARAEVYGLSKEDSQSGVKLRLYTKNSIINLPEK